MADRAETADGDRRDRSHQRHIARVDPDEPRWNGLRRETFVQPMPALHDVGDHIGGGNARRKPGNLGGLRLPHRLGGQEAPSRLGLGGDWFMVPHHEIAPSTPNELMFISHTKLARGELKGGSMTAENKTAEVGDEDLPSPPRALPPAALRALAEAKERRAGSRDAPAREIGGRGGPDPARYGDWEVKGLASDF